MSKTYTSRPSLTSRGRGSTRGQTNQAISRGAVGGAHKTSSNVRGRGSSVSNQSVSRFSGRGSVGQTTRGAMYNSGARSRGARAGMYPPRPGERDTSPEGVEQGAVGHDRQSQEQRLSHQGAYSVVSPNEKKRQQITEQARRETEAYERHKAENKPQYMSYVGTVGGGQMTEDQARRQLIQKNANSKYKMLEKQRMRREEQRRQEDLVNERKKLEARKKTEANERRALREDERKIEEMEKIKNAFLDKLEKTGAQAAASNSASTSTPQNPVSQHRSMSQYPQSLGSANERRERERSRQVDFDDNGPMNQEANSDLQTLYSMFPQYSMSAIAEIYNQNHSLEVTAEILS